MPQVALLLAAVAAVLLAHRAVRPAVSVATAVVVGLATGIVDWGDATDAVRPLAGPLGFLVAAVPLALLLGRIGFFDAAATWITARPWAAGPRLVPALWVFAALTTTVFNLDAAIVLLTPLYLRIAARHGLDPIATTFQPVLLASLASSALPVSNLTNLIVVEELGATAGDLLVRLGPASAAATAVGWFAYRRAFAVASVRVDAVTIVMPDLAVAAAVPGDGTSPAMAPDVAEPHAHADTSAVASGRSTSAQSDGSSDAWRVGGPAVVVLLTGFSLGDLVGLPAWGVAAVVASGLVVATRQLPWRAVPVEAVIIASGLAVLAAAAAPHLGLDRVLSGSGTLAEVRAFGAAVVGANAVNNLPALLVGLPSVDEGLTWAFLAGVNIGPVLWISGSLAGLLWADVMARHGHRVTPLEYARVGVRVGLPALAAAAVVLVVL